MKLSERLEMVISAVRPVEAAADVGTDHGHVPIELVRRGIVRRAVAMDVRKGPLSRAQEHIAEAGLERVIETRLSDGLEKLSPGEAGAVIIAGMGGELMVHILERGRHMWDSVEQWVLSPHSEIPKVRRWLFEHGFEIRRETMVKEDGKYYTVLDVGRAAQDGAVGEPSLDREFLYSRFLIAEKNPVFREFLLEEEQNLMSLIKTLAAQAQESERALLSLRQLEKRLSYNREVQHEMQ